MRVFQILWSLKYTKCLNLGINQKPALLYLGDNMQVKQFFFLFIRVLLSFKRTSCYLSLHKLLSQKIENGTPANPSDEAETLHYSYYLQKIRWENFNTAWTDACLRLRRQISTNCLSEFDNSVVLALKGLSKFEWINPFLSSLKLSENYCFSENFREK